MTDGNIHGAGTQGNRLWLYTPDGRWISLPQGIDEDTAVKSLNVWDGKRWMTPIWHGGVGWYPEQNNDKSLELYAPGRVWQDTLYNPNYATAAISSAYKPMNDNYIRLTHLAARSDPNWRVVPLSRFVPLIPPSQRLEGLHNGVPVTGVPIRVRGMSHGVNSTVGPDGRTGSTDLFNILDYAFSADQMPGDIIGLCRRNATSDADGLNGNRDQIVNDDYFSLWDLKAIRQKLQDVYNHRNIDMTGQLNPIGVQFERRMYVNFDVIYYVNFTGPGIGPALYQGMQMRLFAEKDGPAAAYTGTLRPYYPAALRYTTQTTAAGQLYWTKMFPVVSLRTQTVNPRTGNTTYTSGYIQATYGQRLEITNPGRDNVCFSADLVGIPQLNSDLTYYSVYVVAVAREVEIHYADTGHDTPTSTHKTVTVSI